MERWLDIALLVFALAVIVLALTTGILMARSCISSGYANAYCQAMMYMPHARP